MKWWPLISEDIPELLNNWRVIPRLIMGLYGLAFYQTTSWFMNLPDPTNAQAAFVSTIVGAGAGFFGLYVGSGKPKQSKDKT